MARYYFHIKDGAELIKDQEGSEHATAHEARLQALKTARELWADAIKGGKSSCADAIFSRMSMVSSLSCGLRLGCEPSAVAWQNLMGHVGHQTDRPGAKE